MSEHQNNPAPETQARLPLKWDLSKYTLSMTGIADALYPYSSSKQMELPLFPDGSDQEQALLTFPDYSHIEMRVLAQLDELMIENDLTPKQFINVLNVYKNNLAGK